MRDHHFFYVSTNVKLKIKNKKQTSSTEVLTGVGTFTSTSRFDTLSLQIVRMNELKKSMLGGL